MNALIAPVPGVYWSTSNVIHVDAVAIDEISRVTTDMGRLDCGDDFVKSIEADEEYEGAELLRAFDSDMIKYKRGSVDFSEGDQVFFEDGVEIFNMPAQIFDEDEDEKMKM